MKSKDINAGPTFHQTGYENKILLKLAFSWINSPHHISYFEKLRNPNKSRYQVSAEKKRNWGQFTQRNPYIAVEGLVLWNVIPRRKRWSRRWSKSSAENRRGPIVHLIVRPSSHVRIEVSPDRLVFKLLGPLLRRLLLFLDQPASKNNKIVTTDSGGDHLHLIRTQSYTRPDCCRWIITIWFGDTVTVSHQIKYKLEGASHVS